MNEMEVLENSVDSVESSLNESINEPLVSLKEHMVKTYLWVFIGLLITAAVSYLTVITGLWEKVFSNNLVYLGVVLAQLALAVNLGARIEKMHYATALLSFIGYASLTGVTFSILILAFTPSSIGLAFGFSALLFLDLAVIGMTTKFDLMSIRPLLFGGLLMMVFVSLVGLFIDLSTLEVGICLVGIVIFLGLTAYDTQNIKRLYEMGR